MPTNRLRTYPHLEFVPMLLSALFLMLWDQLDTSYYQTNNLYLLAWLSVTLMAMMAIIAIGLWNKFSHRYQVFIYELLDGLSLFALGLLVLSVGLYSWVNVLYVAMMLIRLLKIRSSTGLFKLAAVLGMLVLICMLLLSWYPMHDFYRPVLPDVMQAVLLTIGLIGIVADMYYLLHHHMPVMAVAHQPNKLNQSTGTDAILNKRIKELVLVISNLTRYIPNQLRSSIIREHHTPTIFNKRTKLSLMFADIVGFTQLSEQLDAEHLANLLNAYMETMTRISTQHGALLDKFIGDGMVCFFGYPKSADAAGDAMACVAMALDMKREMHILSSQWRMMGVDNLHIRVGINTGYCHVGNYGSKDRMSFTVIGKEVNFAARLEAAAQPEEILISQPTYELVQHRFHCQKAGNLKIAGFNNILPCYRVVGEKGATEADEQSYLI